MKNIAYLLALHTIDGLGPMRLRALIDYFKDPKLAWEAEGKEIRQLGIPQTVIDLLLETRKKLNPENYLEDIQKSGIKWMSIFDEEYPKLLKQIYDPPLIIYFKGEILPSDEKAIGVVGTRKITGYGKIITEQFTKTLSQAGLAIVSGLARGVDSVAHKTALEVKGRTLAVLGGGLKKIFPPENTVLAQNICQGFGAILSEFPPDYPSLPGNFPARNRIISGLSLAVLVTEAAQDSGSLITARLALEQGREVFAIPGPITSTLSHGVIDLIKEGARPVITAEEVLDEMGINKVPITKVLNQDGLSENEKKILECLENENKHIDEICRQLNLSAAIASATLLKMEISGLVQNLGSGVYCRS